MVYAKPDQPGLIFVDYGQDGVVFCNYQAMNVTIDNSNVTIETEQGGEYKQIHSPNIVNG